MRLSVIGVGYVGLVTGACFAEMGNDVICYDIDRKKIENLKKGIVPIYESGLSEMVARNHSQGRLSFSSDIKETVDESFIIFIAVGTPSGRRGEANLSAIYDAAKTIAKNMSSYKIIVTKSTVPVGTTKEVERIIGENLANPSLEYDVVNNPEFLKEGAAIEDFMYPDRIIIGCSSPRIAEVMKELYGPFSRRGEKVIVMDINSSEMSKYASNAMLATRISFMNEMARICEAVGADVESVRKGMGSDPRIGSKFLYPGIGFGGSCFPKDVRALVQTAKQSRIKPHLLETTVKINTAQRSLFFDRVKKHFKGKLSGKTFSVWGIAFKPNTDDIREAPAIDVMEMVHQAGGKLRAFDPVAMNNARAHFKGEKGITFGKDNYTILKNVDGLLIFTEWTQFREPDFERVKKLMKKAVIFDGRNLYNPERMKSLGITYYCVGRKQ